MSVKEKMEKFWQHTITIHLDKWPTCTLSAPSVIFNDCNVTRECKKYFIGEKINLLILICGEDKAKIINRLSYN